MTTDRVQPLKIESTVTGGSSNDRTYTALNPQQDAVESAGLIVCDASHRDSTTVIDRDGSDLRFKDGNNSTPVTLSSLVGQEANAAASQMALDGTAIVYDSVRGLTGVSAIMPGDAYDLFWCPCDDYGIGGASQIRAVVNSVEQTITMTAGGVSRQTFPGIFTRSMARASKTALGLAFTLGTTVWSVSAWIHMFAPGSGTSTNKLLTWKDNNNNQHGLAIITPSASDYYAWFPQVHIEGTSRGTWTYNTDRDVILPQHQWSHIAVAYNGTTYWIYRNGALVASAAQSTTATSYNNGIDTISPGDVCAVCDLRIASVLRDESYYLETYNRGMRRFERIPYKNTESWSNMTTERPTTTIWM